jgi:CheY-like chemotaxis protein
MCLYLQPQTVAMPKSGPIILVDDDNDDQEILHEVLKGLGVQNKLIAFKNGHEAESYLRTTADKPFLILCDINMPVMNGLELRAIIEGDPFLKEKSIPFIFLSTTGNPLAVRKAYDLTVQGFFQKQNSLEEMRNNMKLILDYWCNCLHPGT